MPSDTTRIARTPEPPYYAVVFTSVRTDGEAGYSEAAARMLELASEQPGFLGVETVREGCLGITVSYWDSEEAIAAWKRHAEHVEVQGRGRVEWYESFSVRIARVERAYAFGAGGEESAP